MLEITGKYNTAKVYTNNLDDFSREQIETLCNQSFTAGSQIRLMPDVHAGAGCTIGTTMTITDKIVPNLVGVDIGCGMETVVLKADSLASRDFEPARLDTLIHEHIPGGMNVRKAPHEFAEQIELDKIRCPAIHISRAKLSIGTLGGGNHFIEADRDDENNLYIVIHSGSRHLGKEVADYYQTEAWHQLNHNRKKDITETITRLKAIGQQKNIQNEVKRLKAQTIVDIPPALAYVSEDLFTDYINDMKITQQFAMLNRKAMLSVILEGLNIAQNEIENFTTIHNYIDTEAMILRKGAVSAKAGEKFIIPINMRDGSLICEGLGNPDWNFSAPHGAGRLMSRKKAFATLQMEEFKESMTGIYSTSVNEATLDESPMAYKNMDDIVTNIIPTAKILKIIKPIYNYKAAE
ncbi:MAG: RtcB family protein [Candidatus Margulisbacteria bacterium]|jgi:RNA-splicing ligase RtcB|nr:RtcB family protein [Candidatus Margulisiibacteriota bacterium]